ncbi:sigma-54 interaction domain-containing protein [Pararhizobium haloflavum]|uniref:sigma-54 interaction domain-containing protein n=1 Tax=Pararhizobium haloflavum TaxID=2037914 RepID=UPI000C17DAD6
MMVVEPATNRIIRVNAAAAALFGTDCATLKQTKVTRLYQRSLAALHVMTEEALERGHAFSRDIALEGEANGKSDVEHSALSVRRGSRAYLLLRICDLKARRRRTIDEEANNYHRQGLEEWRRAERFFREIERENQLILAAAGEGIYGVNADGVTTFANPAAEAMLGYGAEEMVGQDMHRMVHYKHPDGSHYHSADCPIYKAFREGTVNTVDDEVFWHKDGRPVRVEYTSTPISDNGAHIGAVIVFRDISERKRNEEKLRATLEENARLRERLEMENAYLQEEILTQANHYDIIGNTQPIHKILQQIDLVAPTDANVLITGESGTGKELVARAIHQASQRRDRPLIRVNCAAIPRDLFESEFFGHVKGAFTGAVRDRIGRFELADGGTIFLDEVGEIPLDLQSKLLRVLQDRRFERIGEERTREVDIRLIAATNRDLKTAAAEGRFREDLYFRLNVFPIDCQPLRARRDDIPLLAQHFLKIACARLNIREPLLTRANIEELKAYSWPGNARELQNVIERAAILARNDRMEFHLKSQVETPGKTVGDKQRDAPVDGPGDILTAAEMRQAEAANIKRALQSANGRVSGLGGAAALLAMKPTTLYSKIKALGLDQAGF